MTISESQSSAVTRRTCLMGLSAALCGAASPAFATAPAILTGAGDYRSVHLVNNRTQDWLNTVYWVEGDYVPEAMEAISHLMRDWRAEQVKRIDPRTIDIISGWIYPPFKFCGS
ncbi:MAG: DUF882 domain-containing protein [Pseudomonadota bacterium]